MLKNHLKKKILVLVDLDRYNIVIHINIIFKTVSLVYTEKRAFNLVHNKCDIINLLGNYGLSKIIF